MSENQKLLDLKLFCLKESNNFIGGNIKNHLHKWKQITFDKKVLNIVAGATIIEKCDIVDNIKSKNKAYKFSDLERDKISKEINKMKEQKIIIETKREKGDYVSGIFSREKSDGVSIRIILNLKNLNEYLDTSKFKMTGILQALDLITPNCQMASIDLINAYYSVGIHEEHSKFLKFEWQGKIYKYISLPNGYCRAPFYFTLITKPIAAYLHRLGHFNCFYLDDTLLVSNTREECIKNVLDTANIFHELGFKVHPKKSSFEPSTRIEFLGFVIDSVSMTIELTEKRKNKLIKACELVASNENVTIRILASLIGLMVSSMIAIPMGRLYYRELEGLKIKSLKRFKNWDHNININVQCLVEISWWEENIQNCTTPIHRGKPRLVITSDASRKGFGAICEDKDEFSGHWNVYESKLHINELELLAAVFALKHFAKNFKGHCQLKLDNTTAIQVINKMGSCKSNYLNKLCKMMWSWAYEHEIWISAVYVPSAKNEADEASRRSLNDSEFMLRRDLFLDALSTFDFKPTIDLFASRVNKQLDKFVSYKPQPGAFLTDAFSFSWEGIAFYAFPPFNLVLKTLRKIKNDQATGIIVYPKWEAQPFWPLAMEMAVGYIFILSSRKNLLIHPTDSKKEHRMNQKLNLIMSLVSGKNVRGKDSPQNPVKFC